MKQIFISIFSFLFFNNFQSNLVIAQSGDTISSTQKKSTGIDSLKMNMDAIYNRPFLNINKIPVAIGGYIEANTDYTRENGVSEGLNFQFRRMTLFFSSTISRKIKFLSEIEFEDGTKEISIENALIDMEINPILNIRAGIILNPIGSFNQNHDGPKWDFIDRPLAATQIIPSTLSNVGMGLWGKKYSHQWIIAYEAYLTNGFNDKLILNESNHTSFAEAKEDENKFEKSSSGLPMFTGKFSIRNRKLGEFGISYLYGIYNQWQKAGVQIDEKNAASILAFDFNTSIINNRLNIISEAAFSRIDLPQNYVQNYGSSQIGVFTDLVYNVCKLKLFDWHQSKFDIGCRFEYVDFNNDKFKDNGGRIFDEIWAITPSVALRPSGATVLRLNYKYFAQTDLFGNKPSKNAAIQFGISSYF